MKINKLFHWLYFTVMMLPIFILPIFALAVRSDNNYTPIEIQEEKVEVVNFNQLVINGNYASTDEWTSLVSASDNVGIFSTNGAFTFTSQVIDAIEGHKYYYTTDIQSNFTGDVGIMIDQRGGSIYAQSLVSTADVWETKEGIFTCSSSLIRFIPARVGTNADSLSYVIDIRNTMLVDLTYMFGVGNEPTVQQFNIWYSSDYYDFDTGSEQLLHTGIFDALNDTDLGSQMVYTMYQSVNKYFNFDNVFNFGDLYSWFEINMFYGTAPMGFFIFWHLLIYWLLTSLLWLLFDVLIYVPMLVHRWLDKASLS